MRLTVALAIMALCQSGNVLPAQVTYSPYAKGAPLHSAPEVLQSAIHALEGVHSMEYDVRVIAAGGVNDTDAVYKGRTTVAGTPGSLIRYRAQFRGDGTTELAVSDGQIVRVSAEGELHEYPTRVMQDRASTAALPTLQLFDVERYRTALAAKNAVYAGQDDIEGELCYVVATPALMTDEVGSDTFYYWISARTGLPRSRQTYRILHGKTLITSRFVVSNIKINPELPPDEFTYHPTAADSTAERHVVAPSPTAHQEPEMVGKTIPELEVRDVNYEPVSLLSLVKGKATLITLWATWCGPCVEEMPLFQRLLDRYPGKLQVLAVTVNDSRLAMLNYAHAHTEYHFVFVADPQLDSSGSAIARFFPGEAVPRNILVAPDGRIADYQVGAYEGREDELVRKVDAWIGKAVK